MDPFVGQMGTYYPDGVEGFGHAMRAGLVTELSVSGGRVAVTLSVFLPDGRVVSRVHPPSLSHHQATMAAWQRADAEARDLSRLPVTEQAAIARGERTSRRPAAPHHGHWDFLTADIEGFWRCRMTKPQWRRGFPATPAPSFRLFAFWSVGSIAVHLQLREKI